jgi:hypothetical protein
VSIDQTEELLMSNGTITTNFVSQVARLGFVDALDRADALAGKEVSNGTVRLSVGERLGDGLAGAVWYSGVLRTGSPLLPTVRVDLVVTPWSAGRVEIGLRPLGRLGGLSSLRSNRFFNAAWTVMPSLISALGASTVASRPAAAPATVAA